MKGNKKRKVRNGFLVFCKTKTSESKQNEKQKSPKVKAIEFESIRKTESKTTTKNECSI